jgi:hypothetical protein
MHARREVCEQVRKCVATAPWANSNQKTIQLPGPLHRSLIDGARVRRRPIPEVHA